MDFNALLLLAALWFLVNLMSRAGRKPPASPRPKSYPPVRLPQQPTGLDPTQQEGTRLELVLREFQRALEQGETGARLGRPHPSGEDLQGSESLEVAPEVRSLEDDVHRETRRLVDQDEEAEQIEARRIKAAAERNAVRTRASHAELDQRIRQEPADHTAARGYTVQQLRDAVVWREILGPPVSERGER